MTKIFSLPILVALALGFSFGTSVGQEIRSALPADEGGDSQAGTPVVGDNHQLVPNDLVEVRVFQEADLSTKARVSETGSIRLPLVGEVSVRNLTASEAAQRIEKALADGYLVAPQVTVNVLSVTRKVFTVMGQVNNPGAYELSPTRGITLLEAIGRAGGFTRIADTRRVKVKRTANGRSQVLEFNVRSLAVSGEVEKIILQEGDVVTVGESIF